MEELSKRRLHGPGGILLFEHRSTFLKKFVGEALGRVFRMPWEDRGAQNCFSGCRLNRLSRELILLYDDARGPL
jgi:hypothetical protein